MAAMHIKSNWSVAVAMALWLAGGSRATRGDDQSLKLHTISVTGTGKIAARPDIAEVTAGVLSHAPTAKAALAANNEAMNQLMQILKERGVAEKDVQTSQIQVSPQYSQPPQPHYVGPGSVPPPAAEFVPRIVGYNVENMVRIKARKIDQLGALLDAVVQAGANQIAGISFQVDHADNLIDEARKRAMADAKHKGQLLAGEAGVVLGPPLKIEEQDAGTPRIPRALGASMMAASAPAMPVAPGEQDLSVSVSVIYELRNPK